MSRDLADIVNRIAAIGQTGKTYCQNNFCQDRYHELIALSAKLLSEFSDELQADDLEKYLTEEFGYPTPKTDVRAAIFQDHKILLVQERSDERWTIPGGFADINDSPAEACEREALEEAGVRVKANKLITFCDKRKNDYPYELPHIYKAIYLCEIEEGSQVPEHFSCDEIIDSGFFALDALPTLSPGRISPKHLALCYQHYLNPVLATVFD